MNVFLWIDLNVRIKILKPIPSKCMLLKLISIILSHAFSFLSVATTNDIERFYAKFEEKFFQFCDKELSKVNTFFSGKPQRKYAGLYIGGALVLQPTGATKGVPKIEEKGKEREREKRERKGKKKYKRKEGEESLRRNE